MEKYTDLSKKLGRGSFASVKLVQRNSDKKLLAMKIIDLPNEEAAKSAHNESNFLEKLQHPNIVKFYETFVQKECLYVIMEYCEQGDLQKKVKEAKVREEYFHEEQVLEWFTQVCLAIKQMHDSHVIHRDIKIHNTFLTSNGLVKVGDFGISKQLESTIDLGKTCLGTPFYVSPEMLSYSISSYKSDIWMLGCLLYELCTLEKPFSGDNIPTVIRKILFEDYPPIPSHYSTFLNSLIRKLLDKSQEKRPTIDSILEMPEIQREIEKLISKHSEAYRSEAFTQHKAIPNRECSQGEALFQAKRSVSERFSCRSSNEMEPRFQNKIENSLWSNNLSATWEHYDPVQEFIPSRETPVIKKAGENELNESSQDSSKLYSQPAPKRKANNIRALIERKKATLSPSNVDKLNNLISSNLTTQIPNKNLTSAFSSYLQDLSFYDNSENSAIRPIRVSHSQLEVNEPLDIGSKPFSKIEIKQEKWDNNFEEVKDEKRIEGSKKYIKLSINIPTISEQGDSQAQVPTEKAKPVKVKAMNGMGDLNSIPTTKVTAKKTFSFSDYLFDQKLPTSPNRTFWVSQFLKQKLGDEKFEKVRNLIESNSNPTRLLKEAPEKVLEIIGENKQDCLVMLNFLISHNSNSVTPTGDTKRSTNGSSCIKPSETRRNIRNFKSPGNNPFLKNIFPCVTEPDFLEGACTQPRVGE